MSSHDPYLGDGLDTLLRDALGNLVAGQEPPAHIWPQIEAELTGNTPPSTRPRFARLTSVIPVALAVLLFFALRGASLWVAESPQRASTQVRPSPVARARVEPQPAPPAALTSTDEAELHFLKTRRPSRFQRRPRVNHPSRPVVIAAVDIPPHPASPEGRLLKAEHQGAPALQEEQRFWMGGPYQW